MTQTQLQTGNEVTITSDRKRLRRPYAQYAGQIGTVKATGQASVAVLFPGRKKAISFDMGELAE